MKTVFHLFHGWACDGNIWQPLVNELASQVRAENIEVRNYNRGYFKDNGSESPENSILNKRDKHIVVSHSMGCALVPLDLLSIASQWLIVSGFISFHTVDEPYSRRLLKKMIHTFRGDPVRVVQAFHSRMMYPYKGAVPYEGYQINLNNMNTLKLEEDLFFLDNCSINRESVPESLKLTIFHGSEDVIVNVKHADILGQSLNADHQIISDGGHGIPYTHPALISSAVHFT